MAHKLADLRRIFRVDFTGRDPVLQFEGDIDVSNMANNGNLPNGTHQPGGGSAIPITGRAFNHKGRTFFTWSHEGRPGAFIGELLVDSANKLMVSGYFSVNTAEELEELIKLNMVLNQQEEPWVITKP